MEERGRREESEADVIMEEGLEGCQFLALKLEEGGHEPRNTGSFYNLEKARKDITPEPLECREKSGQHLDFSPM